MRPRPPLLLPVLLSFIVVCTGSGPTSPMERFVRFMLYAGQLTDGLLCLGYCAAVRCHVGYSRLFDWIFDVMIDVM